MSVRVANSRFITSSFAGFYQQILSKVVTLKELGSWLIGEAETAQVFRKAEKLEEISTILCNFPIAEVRTIGNYYKGLGAYRRGEDARSIFEEVAEYSRTYKAKALMSLAAVEARDERYERELEYFTQAMKYADSSSTIVEISRCIAVIKAKEGYHKAALKDLDRVFPLIKYAAPNFYCQYLNSFAVELGEVGRVDEAENMCRVVLASPFVFAYPEWRETWQVLALRGYRSRSSVRVTQTIPRNLLYLPEGEREPSRPSPFQQPSDVTDIADWKKKMVKENGDDNDKGPLTDRQMVMKIMEYATDDELPDEVLYKMLEAVKKISHSYKSKKGEDKDD